MTQTQAQFGTPPINGFGLVDGGWLLALIAGHNLKTISGLTAHAGGTKAAAFQIPDVAVAQFDTVATAADSALLKPAIKGAFQVVFNKDAAESMDLYGQGTDTINNLATATAYALAAGAMAAFFCAEDGKWGAIKTA